MATAEERYDRAMERARAEHLENISAFMTGRRDESGPPLFVLQRKYLIEELGGAGGPSTLAVKGTTAAPEIRRGGPMS